MEIVASEWQKAQARLEINEIEISKLRSTLRAHKDEIGTLRRQPGNGRSDLQNSGIAEMVAKAANVRELELSRWKQEYQKTRQRSFELLEENEALKLKIKQQASTKSANAGNTFSAGVEAAPEAS